MSPFVLFFKQLSSHIIAALLLLVTVVTSNVSLVPLVEPPPKCNCITLPSNQMIILIPQSCAYYSEDIHVLFLNK